MFGQRLEAPERKRLTLHTPTYTTGPNGRAPPTLRAPFAIMLAPCTWAHLRSPELPRGWFCAASRADPESGRESG
eukprot:15446412-Alexandrium_andersonii.AAC.1